MDRSTLLDRASWAPLGPCPASFLARRPVPTCTLEELRAARVGSREALVGEAQPEDQSASARRLASAPEGAAASRSVGSQGLGSARGLGLGFLTLAGVTLGLIVLGALVRAHGAGLACPDWPLCFGELIPRFDFKVAYEWTHRVLASGVSVSLLGLSVAVLRQPGLRRRMARLLLLAWGILAIQVVLGGLTVLLLLQPWTVTAHLMVGLSFCLALVWTGLGLREVDLPRERAPASAGVRRATYVAAGVLLLQIGLGGWVSSHGAGLACPTFPTCDGQSMAPSLGGLVGIQVVHRLNAGLVLVAMMVLIGVSRSVPRVHRLALTALRLLVVQIGVGALNVLLQLKVEITAVHTALAASLLLLLGLAVRECLLARAVGAYVAAGATRGIDSLAPARSA